MPRHRKPDPSIPATIDQTKLSAAFAWAMPHLGVPNKPAQVVQQARERKAHRMPDYATMRNLIDFLRKHGNLPTRSAGAVAPYLWAIAEIAHRCRGREIEVRELTDTDATTESIVVRRHKRSLTNITAWCPELREAWDHLAARRDAIWRERRVAVPITPEARWLVVTEFGGSVGRSPAQFGMAARNATSAQGWRDHDRNAVRITCDEASRDHRHRGDST